MNVAMRTRILAMTHKSQSLRRKWSNMTPGALSTATEGQLQSPISFTDIDTKLLQEASLQVFAL